MFACGAIKHMESNRSVGANLQPIPGCFVEDVSSICRAVKERGGIEKESKAG